MKYIYLHTYVINIILIFYFSFNHDVESFQHEDFESVSDGWGGNSVVSGKEREWESWEEGEETSLVSTENSVSENVFDIMRDG